MLSAQLRSGGYLPVAAGRGAKGSMRPGRHCAGGGILRGENMKLWNLAASGILAFALQTVIFFTTPNTPDTPLVLGPHPLTAIAPRPHTKQCVHQETYTGYLTEYSPAVKL